MYTLDVTIIDQLTEPELREALLVLSDTLRDLRCELDVDAMRFSAPTPDAARQVSFAFRCITDDIIDSR
jgi:hypothetical protein